MSRECNSCDADCYDIEEYCHRCGDITCDDCLDNEWCPSCLDSLEFKTGDFIKQVEGCTAGRVEGISAGKFTNGWPVVRGSALNPKNCRMYTGALSVFEGVESE